MKTYMTFVAMVTAMITAQIGCGGGGGGGVNSAQIKALDATGINGTYQKSEVACTDDENTILNSALNSNDQIVIGGGQVKFISTSISNCTMSVKFDAKVSGNNSVSLTKNGSVSYDGSDCGKLSPQFKSMIEDSAPSDGSITYKPNSKVIQVSYKQKVTNDENGQKTVTTQDTCEPYVRQ